MKTSQYLLSTLTDYQVNSEILSDRLMMRSGMIRKLSSGIYYWLPTGVKVIEKLKSIIRKEMDSIGLIEFSSPLIQPMKLWKKSGRLDQYGEELFRINDRKSRPFILSPTNEESIIYLMKHEIQSYKQLPISLYQIRTKFRDELRPQFGIIRSKEFIMKDAYSFHTNLQSLQKTYEMMLDTYKRIFNRIGLDFRVILAENGFIGGNLSHEFRSNLKKKHSKLGWKVKKNFLKVKKQCSMNHIKIIFIKNGLNIKRIKTNQKSISEILKENNFLLKEMTKLIVVRASQESKYQFVAILMRLNDSINFYEIEKHVLIQKPMKIAQKKELSKIMNFKKFDFIDQFNEKIPIIADHRVKKILCPTIGLKIDEFYYLDSNFKMKSQNFKIYDFVKNLSENYLSQFYNENIEQIRKDEIEIGHIFQIGNKYSRAMNAFFQDERGERKLITMGCYGIGIGRVIAAIIEQNHDINGIVWPDVLAPFQVAILPINMYKFNIVRKVSNDLYCDLKKNNFEVIFDDRQIGFSKMLKDIELIGVPNILIINKFPSTLQVKDDDDDDDDDEG